MGSGTIFASPGPHGTANGKLTRMVQRGVTGTTWQPGTPSKRGESLSWGRNRYRGAGATRETIYLTSKTSTSARDNDMRGFA